MHDERNKVVPSKMQNLYTDIFSDVSAETMKGLETAKLISAVQHVYHSSSVFSKRTRNTCNQNK